MEPFVTRIGDVTIERVVPRGGPPTKETSVPTPSVSLAKRDTDDEGISVSEDLQIFLKPPPEETSKSEGMADTSVTAPTDSVEKVSTDVEDSDSDAESSEVEELGEDAANSNASAIGRVKPMARTDSESDRGVTTTSEAAGTEGGVYEFDASSTVKDEKSKRKAADSGSMCNKKKKSKLTGN